MALCLIVDDSESMREIAAEHVAALGHEVREADGAEAAIAALAQASPPVDLVLLDWDLPSLGALDVPRAASARTPRPAIILCATENDTRQFDLARAAGAAHHLLKPYDADSIRAAVTQAVGEEAARRA